MKYTMADGRAFTRYISNSEYEQYIKKKYNIKSDYEYRLFLQQNGDKIMKELDKCDDDDKMCLRHCPVCRTEKFQREYK